MQKITLLLLSFVFLSTPVFAGTVNLPRSGQTTSYGSEDDGSMQAGVVWPDPRFTLNGDCVTDNLTGLVWTKNANLPNNWITWNEALDYIKQLNNNGGLCGYADWRLPNVNELESIVNYGAVDLASWLNSQGYINVEFCYWSSTSISNNYSLVAYFNVDGGSGGGIGFEDKKDDYHMYVWPVRGGEDDFYPCRTWKTGQKKSYHKGDDGDLQKGIEWPDPRFTVNVNDNGWTITDNLTGLMWMKNAYIQDYTDCDRVADTLELDWEDALGFMWCVNEEKPDYYSGYKDWRLPNQKELYSLCDIVQTGFPEEPFINVQNYYWTSTTLASDKNFAWLLGASVGTYTTSKDSIYPAVWPVRGGQTGRERYNISGNITFNNSGLSGVTLALTGNCSFFTTTDNLGNYSFSGLAYSTYIYTGTYTTIPYTITPNKSGYIFAPLSRTVAIQNTDVTGQDFTAIAVSQGYSISGKVIVKGTNAPLQGVTMTLSGGSSATTSTDNNGNYSFSGLANGSYKIMPTKNGYKFSPTSKKVKINNKNVTNVNFKAKTS